MVVVYEIFLAVFIHLQREQDFWLRFIYDC